MDLALPGASAGELFIVFSHLNCRSIILIIQYGWSRVYSCGDGGAAIQTFGMTSRAILTNVTTLRLAIGWRTSFASGAGASWAYRPITTFYLINSSYWRPWRILE